MTFQTNPERSQPSSDPLDSLTGIEGMGLRLSRDSRDYFEAGYLDTDMTFDPSRNVLDNVIATLRTRIARGDMYAPNQGGYVLGVIARLDELNGGQK